MEKVLQEVEKAERKGSRFLCLIFHISHNACVRLTGPGCEKENVKEEINNK